jgi:hypothetical protein
MLSLITYSNLFFKKYTRKEYRNINPRRSAMARASLPSLPLAASTGRLRQVGRLHRAHLQAWYLPAGLALLWWLASRN